MGRENLSDIEIEMVDKMNIANNQDDSNVFAQASVQAIIQHLIECVGEEDVLYSLNFVVDGEPELDS